MAKMNSRGASPSRLEPLGICNHDAKTPVVPGSKIKDMPNNMISTVKSILYILTAGLPATSNLSSHCSWLAARGSKLFVTGILFFYGRRSYRKQTRTGDAALQLPSERHRKKLPFFPS